jgi:hypothetical protein
MCAEVVFLWRHLYKILRWNHLYRILWWHHLYKIYINVSRVMLTYSNDVNCSEFCDDIWMGLYSLWLRHLFGILWRHNHNNGYIVTLLTALRLRHLFGILWWHNHNNAYIVTLLTALWFVREVSAVVISITSIRWWVTPSISTRVRGITRPI